MKKIRIIVLEDEEDIRKWLISKLGKVSEFSIVGEAASVEDAFDLIVSVSPDVAFMDVKLLGGDAFTLLNRLKEADIQIPYIVMATGFPEYVMTALNDYREYIVQYLLKPFVGDWDYKLGKAIDAIQTALNKDREYEDRIILEEKETAPYLFIKTKTEYSKIEFKKLYYLEAGGGGTSLLVYEDRIIELNITLSRFLEKLPKNLFIRVSKTNIVNIKKVEKIIRDERTLSIHAPSGVKTIGIGDVYYTELKKALKLD